jgi:hypothetical protein
VSEFDEPAFTVVAPVKLMVVFVGVPLWQLHPVVARPVIPLP